MALQFSDLYTPASQWAGDITPTGVTRAKTAVAEANRMLSYGMQHPPLRPWWRKREDTITPVAATQAYTFPTSQGTLEATHEVWYRIKGDRFVVDIVDDQVWTEEVNENTAVTGTPEICNLFSDAGDVYKLRFNPIPSSGFISTIDGGLIRLDFYIEETLTSASADTAEPLMPNSRRMGIVWKAMELLGAMQGDPTLIKWGAQQGARYYAMIFNDDVARTGGRTRQTRPLDAVGMKHRGLNRTDYGRVRA